METQVMPFSPARRVELTPEERRKCLIPVEQAAEIKGISLCAFREHYAHLIEHITPKRLGVRLGNALD
jgi:hypothetical protein